MDKTNKRKYSAEELKIMNLGDLQKVGKNLGLCDDDIIPVKRRFSVALILLAQEKNDKR